MTLAAIEAEWPAPPGIRALVTTRRGGASTGPYASLNLALHVGDDPTAVAENRARLVRALALAGEPCWLEQVHGTCVADFDADPNANRRAADAAVTGEPGRVLAVLTADCLPVVLASIDGERLGVAHAGWRGLAAGVIERTVQALGRHGAELRAWLGPAIGPTAYEVGGEVRAAFVAQDPEAAGGFVPNARGRFLADLAWLARRRLRALGVLDVHGGGYCTFGAADAFYSHRREAPCGRMATLVWREPL